MGPRDACGGRGERRLSFLGDQTVNVHGYGGVAISPPRAQVGGDASRRRAGWRHSMAHFIITALLSWSDSPPKRRRNCSIDALPFNATLTQMGLCTGTDKAHASMFLEFYPFVLDRMRPLTFNMLEIGVAFEGSLKMWDRYFPKASIFGADAMPLRAQGYWVATREAGRTWRSSAHFGPGR
jgi:hypothetical protein